MSFSLLLQIFINLVFLAGFLVVFARLRRPTKDDPRLSRGLQLLSSKIAVLEDLSDRTESQVNQMIHLLESKSKELQSKIGQADTQMSAIRVSMDKSLEVAKIFQDKIPHSEIIERQNSMKYIQAARLAHAGVNVADIARDIDLPIGEIEFIAKVNRENLTFREEELPEWARDPRQAPELAEAPNYSASNYGEPVLSQSAPVSEDSLARLGDEFRRAMSNAPAAPAPIMMPPSAPAIVTTPPASELEAAKIVAARIESAQKVQREQKEQNTIRKVEFPRLDG